ncbi:MAG: Yop proteins translocation protein U [Chlamydiae bacterium]|nr:Yop proteins translocation protein U [Chlamydiota bacterium]
MAEKTEKATPKKLRDARKKGQVAKSQDLPSAFTFIASVSAVLSLIGYLYAKIADFTIAAFTAITKPDLLGTISGMYTEAILTIFACAGPIVVFVAIVGTMVNFLAVGPVFSVQVFKPDIKKFDPIQNLKGKFKLKTLFELLKSLFKISVAAFLIYGVMYKSLPVLTKTVTLPLIGSLLIFHAFLVEVLWKVGLLFVVVAIADFIFQRRNFAKEMKMEKFEVKQEYKNTEGDPQIKSKRKQIAQEIAYQEGPAAGVEKSKAVVTNPTHLAIAIGYDTELDAAPWITAMGKEKMAEQIIHLADKYNKPIIQNIPVAHQLWNDGELYDYVPEDTFETLAEILRWVASLEENAGIGIEDLDLE